MNTDILELIFNKLCINDLLKVKLVCKQWANIIMSNFVEGHIDAYDFDAAMHAD